MKKDYKLSQSLWWVLYFTGIILMSLGTTKNELCTTIQGAAFFMGSTHFLSASFNKLVPIPIPVPATIFEEEKKDDRDERD